MTQPRRELRRSDCGSLRPADIALWALVTAAVLCAAGRANAQPAPSRPAAPLPAERSGVEVVTVPDDDIPPYHFSRLKFTGRVSDDGKVARLKADIEVHINHGAGWYDVPLRLTQAAVTHLEYSGPQEPIPYQPNGQDDGVHWLFRGLGRHRLTLDLVVELRATAAGTNLQLTLPSGSRYYRPELNLTVPIADLTVEAGKENTVETSPGAPGETVIDADIEGNRLDVTWRAVAQRRGQVVRSLTSMVLDRKENSLRLQAVQDFATDGEVNQVEVRLPERFRLLEVSGPSYLSHTELANDPGWVRVDLATANQTDLQLVWQLTSDFPIKGGTVVVDGFEVRGAIRQSGTLGIAPIPGFRVQRLSSNEDDGIEREEPRRLRPTGGIPFLNIAWRFARQPFELTLDVQEERPSFDARTRALVTAYEDRILLELDYLVHVHSGLVKEFQLRWPGPGAEDWNLVQDSDEFVVTDGADESSQFPGELQRIELTTPRDGEFSIRLKFQRPLVAGPFELGIPELTTERRQAAWVILRGMDSVAPRVDPDPDLAPLTDSAADVWLRSQSVNPERDQAYRMTGPRLQLTGRIEEFPLEIQSRATVSVTRPDAAAFRVEQQVVADVRYGRIAQLQFQWPAVFPGVPPGSEATAVTCRLTGGLQLAATADSSGLRVSLPEPMQGQISLTIEYLLPLAAGRSSINVPIFLMSGAPYKSTLVVFPESTMVRASGTDAAWLRVPTALHPTWTTTAERETFTADLSVDVASAPQHYLVESILARISYDPSGRSRMALNCRLRNAPPRIALAIPAVAEGVRFLWEGASPRILSASAGPSSTVYEIVLTEGGDPVDGWLQMIYQQPAAASLDSLGPIAPRLPTLPEAVAVNETIVEIALPTDHSLLTYPQGMTPLFEWRPGLVFRRELNESYRKRREDLHAPGANGTGASLSEDDTAHVYAFWIHGEAPALTFRVIRLWMLILIGSGLTLGLAFLLWSVSATRNILTLLVLGFGIAVLGVFWPEAVELLLQPVLLGLCAAIIAIGTQKPRLPEPGGAGHGNDSHSTHSEHAGRVERSPAPAASPLPATKIAREMQESGSHP